MRFEGNKKPALGIAGAGRFSFCGGVSLSR
jgi:hypothetical protein